MRVGIDFDNTIANYEGVFHAAAVERGLIPADLGTAKNDVRDYLNASGRKDEFTELQGYVYGARMDLVSLYPGVADFIAAAAGSGREVFVVSHKTRTPLLGQPYDMHAAARDFLRSQRLFGPGLLTQERTFFEPTKEEKVARVASLELDVFIDDLPEILTMAGFPETTRRILFDPQDALAARAGGLERYLGWSSLHRALLG